MHYVDKDVLVDKRWDTLKEYVAAEMKTAATEEQVFLQKMMDHMEEIDKEVKPILDIEVRYSDDIIDEKRPYIFHVKTEKYKSLSKIDLSRQEALDYANELREKFEFHRFSMQ